MQKLFIDGKYIGYVKEYYQNRLCMSWIFVLDTIDTGSNKYTLQVKIGFDKIKFFNGNSNEITITTFDLEDKV